MQLLGQIELAAALKPKICCSYAGNFCGALLAYFGASVIKATTLPVCCSLQSTTLDTR